VSVRHSVHLVSQSAAVMSVSLCSCDNRFDIDGDF
jgi:hypothetical protein